MSNTKIPTEKIPTEPIASTAPQPLRMSTADLRRCAQMGEDPQLVDVRSPAEYAAGHVPGAINIPMDQMPFRLPDLVRHRPVVLICQSGKRAAMTAQVLQPHHDQVHVLEGGTAAWMEHGNPVVSANPGVWAIERQVRLVAGTLVVTGVALALLVDPLWALLSGAVGLGLAVAALTDSCLMGSLLMRMPWNRPAACQPTPK